MKPTELVQISSPDLPCVSNKECPACGAVMQVVTFLGNITESCQACEELKRQAQIDAEHQAQIAVREEQRKRKAMEQLRTCGIGERFVGMTFRDYKPTNDKASKVLSSCQGYVSSFKNNSGCNLLMIGSPGTGKNMLAGIIGQEVIKLGFSFLHTTALKLVRKVKDSWRNNELSEQGVIDSFVIPDLLVIDEIGVQFGTPTEQLYLTEIINERYEKRRPTVLISNLKLSQLTEVMGERVIDRFYDDGSSLMIFDWESYRRKQTIRLVA